MSKSNGFHVYLENMLKSESLKRNRIKTTEPNEKI